MREPESSSTKKGNLEQEGSGLAPHVEGTVRAIAQLHDEHRQQASPVERAIDRATATFTRPAFLFILSLGVCVWVGLNLILPRMGIPALDSPPFPWLIGALALLSLYMSILILTTQRRVDRLANRRDQMTLELAFLNEYKTAKIIGLLEELRYDSPDIRNRVDQEADAMATPADAHAMLDAIDDKQTRDIRDSPSDR